MVQEVGTRFDGAGGLGVIAGLAHQAGDAFAATTNVVVIGKLRVNPRCAIG